MARKKFEQGFKDKAVAYCQEHSEKTIKACAEDLDIGYSTLRRWIAQSEEKAEAVAAPADVTPEKEAPAKPAQEVEAPVVESAPSETVEQAPASEEAPEPAADPVSAEPLQESKQAEPEPEPRVEYTAHSTWQAPATPSESKNRDRVAKLRDQVEGALKTAESTLEETGRLLSLYKKKYALKLEKAKLNREKERRKK
ncbi:MAG: transposase [Peptococcaceae bacterium]|nr:transposase [Peptococcaceae bacterium]